MGEIVGASGAETTVQDLIDALTRAASHLPEGTGARVGLGICDGRNLQLIDNIDVDFQVFMRRQEDGPPVPEHWWVLIRGHWHPGESPGEVQRGVTADVDDELRALTEDDQ